MNKLHILELELLLNSFLGLLIREKKFFGSLITSLMNNSANKPDHITMIRQVLYKI